VNDPNRHLYGLFAQSFGFLQGTSQSLVFLDTC